MDKEQSVREENTKIGLLHKDFDHKIDSKKINISHDPPNKSDTIKKEPISLNNKLPELNTFNHSTYHYTNFIND